MYIINPQCMHVHRLTSTQVCGPFTYFQSVLQLTPLAIFTTIPSLLGFWVYFQSIVIACNAAQLAHTVVDQFISLNSNTLIEATQCLNHNKVDVVKIKCFSQYNYIITIT